MHKLLVVVIGTSYLLYLQPNSTLASEVLGPRDCEELQEANTILDEYIDWAMLELENEVATLEAKKEIEENREHLGLKMSWLIKVMTAQIIIEKEARHSSN